MSSVCKDLQRPREVAGNYGALVAADAEISKTASICNESAADIDWNERFRNVIASLILIIDLLLEAPPPRRRKNARAYFIKNSKRIDVKYHAIDWFGWFIAAEAKNAPSGRLVLP